MDGVLARQLRGDAGHAGRVPGGRAARLVPRAGALSQASPALPSFTVLDSAAGFSLPLPADLAAIYGSDLGLPERGVYANFVQSIDGVVAIPGAPSGSLISGKNAADRFVMAILRAAADCVLLGAGTLRATPGHRWTAQHVYPELAQSFGAWRGALGLPPDPPLVVVTRGGDVDVNHPAIQAGATLLTTARAQARLQAELPGTSVAVALGDDDVSLPAALRWIHDQGWGRVLSEAGPHVMAQLVDEGLVAELFLTVSPVLAGRPAEPRRLGLLEGVGLLPGRRIEARLAGARRSGDFLFLRYAL